MSVFSRIPPEDRETIIRRALDTFEGQAILSHERREAYNQGWADALAMGIPDTPRGRAERFLRERLAQGSVPAAEIVREAHSLGIKKRTLDRAKVEIGACSERLDGVAVWRLRPDIANVANSAEFGGNGA